MKEKNKYGITYKYLSTKLDIGQRTRLWCVYASSFGEAERMFEEQFALCNSIVDDLYGDDAIYELLDIKRFKEEESK